MNDVRTIGELSWLLMGAQGIQASLLMVFWGVHTLVRRLDRRRRRAAMDRVMGR